MCQGRRSRSPRLPARLKAAGILLKTLLQNPLTPSHSTTQRHASCSGQHGGEYFVKARDQARFARFTSDQARIT